MSTQGRIVPDGRRRVLTFHDTSLAFDDMIATPPALIRARALTGFPALVAAHGGDVLALLRRAGISPSLLERPDATLPFDRLAHLLDDAATSLGVPDFGVQLAAHQDISVLGAVALIARHAPTVGDALRGIGRNLAYHTPAARLHNVDDPHPGWTQLRYELNLGPGVPRRQAVELSYAVAIAFLRLVTGESGAKWHLRFRHAAGMTPGRYRKAFGCPVHPGQDADMLVVPTRLFSTPVNPDRVELQRAAERFVSNVIRRFPLDVAQQVEALIERQLASGGCGVDVVAKQMGLHTRTLQRRLEAQGLRFEDIVDRMRRNRAAELLPHAAIPLAQVGELLGYAEQSSFNRACRRWFGDTPQAVRLRPRQRLR